MLCRPAFVCWKKEINYLILSYLTIPTRVVFFTSTIPSCTQLKSTHGWQIKRGNVYSNLFKYIQCCNSNTLDLIRAVAPDRILKTWRTYPTYLAAFLLPIPAFNAQGTLHTKNGIFLGHLSSTCGSLIPHVWCFYTVWKNPNNWLKLKFDDVVQGYLFTSWRTFLCIIITLQFLTCQLIVYSGCSGWREDIIWSILFYPFTFHSILFCSVLSCPVLSYSVLLGSVLFCSVLFCSVLTHSVPFRSSLYCSALVWSGLV